MNMIAYQNGKAAGFEIAERGMVPYWKPACEKIEVKRVYNSLINGEEHGVVGFVTTDQYRKLTRKALQSCKIKKAE